MESHERELEPHEREHHERELVDKLLPLSVEPKFVFVEAIGVELFVAVPVLLLQSLVLANLLDEGADRIVQ